MRGAAEDDGPIHEGANESANGSAKGGIDDGANDRANERVNQAGNASGGASRAGRARRARRDGWTAHRRGLFLDTLRATLNVRAAARAAQMSAQTAHDLRRRDPDFARAWAGALDDGAAEMEFRLLECGMFGVETEEVITETGPITRADGTVAESRRIVRVTRTVAGRRIGTHDGRKHAGMDGAAERRVYQRAAAPAGRCGPARGRP